jgi:hypothetical protein
MIHNFMEPNILRHLYFKSENKDRYLFGDNGSHVKYETGSVSANAFNIFDNTMKTSSPRKDVNGNSKANVQSITDQRVDSMYGNNATLKNHESGQYLDPRTSYVSPEVYAAMARGEEVKVTMTQLAPERVNLVMPLLASVMQIVGGLAGGAAYNEELSQAITGKGGQDKGSLGKAADFVSRHGTSYSLNPFGGGEHIDVIAEFQLLNKPAPQDNTPVTIPPIDYPKRKAPPDPIPEAPMVSEGDRTFTQKGDLTRKDYNKTVTGKGAGNYDETGGGIRERENWNVASKTLDSLEASHGLKLSKDEKGEVFSNEENVNDAKVFFLGKIDPSKDANDPKNLEKSFTTGVEGDNANIVQARRYILGDYLGNIKENRTPNGDPYMTPKQKETLAKAREDLESPDPKVREEAGRTLFGLLKEMEGTDDKPGPLNIKPDGKVGAQHYTSDQDGLVNSGQFFGDADAGAVHFLNGGVPKDKQKQYEIEYNKKNGLQGDEYLSFDKIKTKQETAFVKAYNEANGLTGDKKLNLVQITEKVVAGDYSGIDKTRQFLQDGIKAVRAELKANGGALMEHTQLKQLDGELEKLDAHLTSFGAGIKERQDNPPLARTSDKELQQQGVQFISDLDQNLNKIKDAMSKGIKEINGRPVADLIKEMEAQFQDFLKQGIPIDAGKCQDIANKFSNLKVNAGIGGNNEVSETMALIDKANKIAPEDKVETPVTQKPAPDPKSPVTFDTNTDTKIKGLPDSPAKTSMTHLMSYDAESLKNPENNAKVKSELAALFDQISKSGDEAAKGLLEIADRILQRIHRESEAAGNTMVNGMSGSLSDTYVQASDTGKKLDAAFATTLSKKAELYPDPNLLAGPDKPKDKPNVSSLVSSDLAKARILSSLEGNGHGQDLGFGNETAVV